MAWKIEFDDKAIKQLDKLDSGIRKRMLNFLYERAIASGNPRSFGEPLTGTLASLWRYRVGHYRIVCDIRDGELLVLVVQVGHRREIYR